jgi:hypothetical protein
VWVPETGASWDTVQQGIVQLTECCKHGGCIFAPEMIAEVLSLSKPLTNAMKSERSRLSGSAIELLIALSAGLGPAFEPLISPFFPAVLGLCARTNTVFTRRSKACVFAVIENTKLPSLLPYLTESVNHKSASLRQVAANGVIACLNCFNSHNNARAHLIEGVIKLTARDSRADVRKAGEKISQAYDTLRPDSVDRFA